MQFNHETLVRIDGYLVSKYNNLYIIHDKYDNLYGISKEFTNNSDYRIVLTYNEYVDVLKYKYNNINFLSIDNDINNMIFYNYDSDIIKLLKTDINIIMRDAIFYNKVKSIGNDKFIVILPNLHTYIINIDLNIISYLDIYFNIDMDKIKNGEYIIKKNIYDIYYKNLFGLK